MILLYWEYFFYGCRSISLFQMKAQEANVIELKSYEENVNAPSVLGCARQLHQEKEKDKDKDKDRANQVAAPPATESLFTRVKGVLFSSAKVGFELGWVGLGWVGLGWVGLGWVGLGWVGLGWVGGV